MNNLRKLCMALALTLTLSATALAGQVNCPGVMQEPPTPEEIESGTQSEADSMVTDALLILIESVLLAP
ncbi:MAG TPA: hypothetical protein VF543_18000 [Pyrinomonadaceae bacterium]|jgi:acetylglutamate kinase